jgi:hypothetical protein
VRRLRVKDSYLQLPIHGYVPLCLKRFSHAILWQH